MAQRFENGDRIQLSVDKTFDNPDQVLKAGAKGTVLLKFLDKLRYRIQFDERNKPSIIKDTDLK